MSGFAKILVTTDLSDFSKAAFPLAVDLAKKYSAKITLAHVFEEDLVAVYPIIVGYLQPEVIEASRHIEDARSRAGERLKSIAEHVRSQGVPVDTLLRGGSKPYLEIVKLAEELPADMIVLSTHGRTGLSHALIGSTTERILRKSPCPVLVVKPQAPLQTAP